VLSGARAQGLTELLLSISSINYSFGVKFSLTRSASPPLPDAKKARPYIIICSLPWMAPGEPG